ncbi:hypothetical protein Pcinc_015581, partial [Petrolisthes cinctipes]
DSRVVEGKSKDVVSVVVGERGVADGCLLSAMSGHGGVASDGGGGRGRRKLENEDSSYDSDFEPNERQDDEHEDVYRTDSDTLGAEFAEYVNRVPTSTTDPVPATLVVAPTAPSTITFTTTPVPASAPAAPSHPATATPAPTPATATTPHTDASTPIAAPSTPTTDAATAKPATATTTTTLAADASASATTTTNTTVTTATTTTPQTITSTTSTTPTATSTTTTTTVTAVAAASSSTTTTTTTPSTTTATTSCTTTTTTSATNKPATTTPTPLPPPPSPPAVCVTPPAPAPPRVTLTQPPLAPIKVTGSSASPGDSGDTVGDTGSNERGSPRSRYASQVEFGVKLGYTECLVQLALVKLGGAADKDELLAELIRLGTTAPRPEGDDVTHDDSSDAREDPDHFHHQQQQQQQQQQQTLKPIIIDGSNVAMSHGNKTTFSCRGLRVCVDWFRARGHTEITVFVPAWRKEAPRWDTAIADQEVLLELERERVLVFTPSRVCGGKRIVSYDDRYILKEAVEAGGIVVSNDNYRDLAAESPAFRRVVEESLLMYSWVNGRFVPPDDPLGRSGPTLDVFLRRRDKQAPCPYGRKCTYGNKCKYMHPERGTAPLKSVTERLQEQAQRHYQNKAMSRDSSPGEGLRANKSLSLPVGVGESEVAKKPLTRTKSIVPAVSLTLPSALTQETPSRDPQAPHHHLMTLASDPRPQEQRGSEHRGVDLRRLDQHPMDPLRPSPMFKSDSSLYHMYASQGYCSPAWGWKGQGGEVAMRTLTSPPSQYMGHLPLGKNLSDPDQASSENPHRKLQRQLTLNPAFDSRLYKIVGFREPAPEHFPISGHTGQQGQQPTQEHFSITGHSQQGQQAAPDHFTMSGQQSTPEHYHISQQGQSSPSRSVRSEGEGLVVSPGYSSPYGSREQLAGGGSHAPLARHSSQDTGKQPLPSLPPHLYPSYTHPQVARFASAPDSIWGGQQQHTSLGPPHINRLNSTSDTHLNVYGGGDTHYIHDMYEDHLSRLAPFPPGPPHHGPSQATGAPSPGPIGSRPMSPQQGSVMHHSPSVSPRQHTPPHQHNIGLPSQQNLGMATQQSSMTLSSQQGAMGLATQQSNMGVTGQQGGSFAAPLAGSSHEDLRLRVFYHLSQLFPEAQVRAVMAMHPEETDPHKICSYMLGSGGSAVSRPLSPQQSPSPLSATQVTASHEDARFRLFYHLSQLFPEAQVRAVMAMHPEETDPHKICSYMLGSGGSAVSCPLSSQQSPSPLSGSFSTPATQVTASHEDARFRLFYHLSQLFPEAQVRAVLARHPDHTDPRHFCATLINRLSGNQS